MMINVVLYNDESIIRIAKRAVALLEKCGGFRTTRDTIWANGMYLKFAPRMLSFNVFDTTLFPEYEVIEYLRDILLGEEVYVSDDYQFHKYIDKVDASTEFQSVLSGDYI